MPRCCVAGRTFDDVRERAAHDLDDVIVGKRVGDVASLPPPHEQVLGAEDAEPLRDGGEAVALGEGEFRHAARAIGEPRQHAKPGFVSDGAEQPDGPLDCEWVGWQRPAARSGMIPWAAVGGRVG